jgi:hypothetical protein
LVPADGRSDGKCPDGSDHVTGEVVGLLYLDLPEKALALSVDEAEAFKAQSEGSVFRAVPSLRYAATSGNDVGLARLPDLGRIEADQRLAIDGNYALHLRI